jgi:hypothetical protein
MFWVAVSGRREQEASFFTVIVRRDQRWDGRDAGSMLASRSVQQGNH